MDERHRPLMGNLSAAISPDRAGSASITPAGSFEAGSYGTFRIVYTAGFYGIDDSGSLKIVFRLASDQTKPQLSDPKAAGYVTVVASNNATLAVRYDPKGSVRPWDQTLYIKVVDGFLKEGDRITVTFGDTSGGSPGMRLQTFCEASYEFRVLVDPIATYTYVALPDQPAIAIVPGPPHKWVAVLPTRVRAGEPFRLSLKAEDRWGNPTDKADAVLRPSANGSIENLPPSIAVKPGQFARIIDGLIVREPGVTRIELRDDTGAQLAISNPLEIIAADARQPLAFWADLHGQSEETVGTNLARDYFLFARDRAFLDVVGHQGNDFQITKAFWRELNGLMGEFHEPGRFVTIPGYEWSGNTPLGGDRNVFYMSEDRPIYRSSHALLDDLSDADSDCGTAAALFETLAAKNENAICIAHCGGRYADVKVAHDGRFERSVEVHSSWGTFEWIFHDAIDMGYRVGIVANSDGHKGRPGASYPGASLFGAIGGLTCLNMNDLSRESVFECLRKRYHFGTTGNRMIFEVSAMFDEVAEIYHDDPLLGPAEAHAAQEAVMGDIVHLRKGAARLAVRAVGSAPIERIDLFNGRELLATRRPFSEDGLGRRIRVIWEGAEYRGRFRQVIWDGQAEFTDARIGRTEAINFFSRDKTLDQTGDHLLSWKALSTGNFGGFDVWLDDGARGALKIDTPLVKEEIPLARIGFEDLIFDAGKLGRKLRLFRLPDENVHNELNFEHPIILREDGDNVLFARVTQEDGHQAWSSPIYIYR